MGRTPNSSSRLRDRRGFTLIEVILVVAIGGIMAAVLVPMTYRSLHGNQRRMAVRSVVAVAKYARSMAVLQQRQMLLTINPGTGTLLVDAAPSGRSVLADEAAEANADRVAPVLGVGPALPPADQAEPLAFRGAPVRLQRQLSPIEVVGLSIDGSPGGTLEGVHRVRFDTNGRCQPFEVVLEDSRKERVRVAIDHLGTATTEVLP